MMSFLRFAKTRVINGKLFAVWKEFAKKLHYPKSISSVDVLWFLIDKPRSRSRSPNRSGSRSQSSLRGTLPSIDGVGKGTVRMVTQEGGAHNNDNLDDFYEYLVNTFTDFVDIRPCSGVRQGTDLILDSPNEDFNYLIWASQKIQSHK
jgi:hypothetical protein